MRKTSPRLMQSIEPFFLLLLFFRQQKIQRLSTYFTLAAFLHMTLGCNYYRVQTEDKVTAERVAGLPNYKRFVLHQGNNKWELKDISVKDNAVEGSLHAISDNLIRYMDAKPGKPNRYKSADKNIVLNVVHLYIFEYAQGENNRISIPLSSIKKIDITDRDTGTTIASHVLATAGITFTVLALIGIIVLLTKSSCPFVYTYNGTTYDFVGEAYGGAIFSPLERHDYMPLPGFTPLDNTYQIKIANELKERQYTNLTELMVVQHPESVQVLLDTKGNPQTIQQLQSPVSAIASDGQEYTRQVAIKDSSAFLFNHQKENLTSIILQFTKPAEATRGKLVLHARNSLWLDYLYGEFTQQFGGYYNTWAKDQKTIPASAHNQWQMEQGIPLSVAVETKNGWKSVDHFHTVGPLAGRDLAMPVDLSGISGNEVKIKLTSGFMFWEVDQAGMDFSDNMPIQIQHLQPISALNEDGKNVKKLLSADDTHYVKQLHTGDEVIVKYEAPVPQPNYRQTIFLHTKGYYEHIREYEGIPNPVTLQAFKRPGRFMEFSREKYQEVSKILHLNTAISAYAIQP